MSRHPDSPNSIDRPRFIPGSSEELTESTTEDEDEDFVPAKESAFSFGEQVAQPDDNSPPPPPPPAQESAEIEELEIVDPVPTDQPDPDLTNRAAALTASTSERLAKLDAELSDAKDQIKWLQRFVNEPNGPEHAKQWLAWGESIFQEAGKRVVMDAFDRKPVIKRVWKALSSKIRDEMKKLIDSNVKADIDARVDAAVDTIKSELNTSHCMFTAAHTTRTDKLDATLEKVTTSCDRLRNKVKTNIATRLTTLESQGESYATAAVANGDAIDKLISEVKAISDKVKTAKQAHGAKLDKVAAATVTDITNRVADLSDTSNFDQAQFHLLAMVPYASANNGKEIAAAARLAAFYATDGDLEANAHTLANALNQMNDMGSPRTFTHDNIVELAMKCLDENHQVALRHLTRLANQDMGDGDWPRIVLGVNPDEPQAKTELPSVSGGRTFPEPNPAGNDSTFFEPPPLTPSTSTSTTSSAGTDRTGDDRINRMMATDAPPKKKGSSLNFLYLDELIKLTAVSNLTINRSYLMISKN